MRNHIKELSKESKNIKIYKTIESKYFKKKIKIFKNKNTKFINTNLKRIFKLSSVKEWYIFSKKLEKILLKDDFKLKDDKIITTLILSFIKPDCEYLLSSYHPYSSRRLKNINNKFLDIKFLIKSLILNNDKDEYHLKRLKYKLNHIGISKYKFVFESKLKEINTDNIENEMIISDNEKDIITHYLTNNRRKKSFKIYKTSNTQIYDAFFLFFLDLNNYELSNILFYKKNFIYFDYDYEIFVLRKN